MKAFYFIPITLISLTTFSQQQLGNVYVSNNANPPTQIYQTNILTNTGNFNKNEDNNQMQQQQVNYSENNIGNEMQIKQSSNNAKQRNDIVSNGRGIDFSFNFSSRSSSTSGISSKKTSRHTFHKKITKFNRNFYGKMTLHKKSKHLVDVCFNWSR